MNDIDKTLVIAKAMELENAGIADVCDVDQAVFYWSPNHDPHEFCPLSYGHDSQMVQAHFNITVNINCIFDKAGKPFGLSAHGPMTAGEKNTYFAIDGNPTPELIRRAIFESAWLSIEGGK
jgi:hypothetical protein